MQISIFRLQPTAITKCLDYCYSNMNWSISTMFRLRNKMQLTQILLGATRRRLTSKYAGKHFYKGRGVRNIGYPTKGGGYVIVPKKVQQLVIPDLTGFELKPYVTRKIEEAEESAPLDADSLLEAIKVNFDDIPYKEIP